MANSNNGQPPMAWRYCGGQLKLWRESASVSRQSLADEAGYDYEYVKSMEYGRRKPTQRLLQIADQMCGAGGKLLAGQGYLKPEPFPERTQEYMQVEAEAIALHVYESLLITGLLQTEAYMRELMSNDCPPLDEETLEERVAGRLKRQAKLDCKPPAHFSFVLYEAALRALVGGPEVMRRQFKHLLTVGEKRNVSIQVLPFSRAPYVALNGSFILAETDEHQQYAFVEGQETGALYPAGDKFSTLTQRHGMIRMQALDVEASADFIRGVANGL
ncbi:helix-turn-helix domain-containing protein [Streptomyces sp. NPDC002851]